MFVPSSWAPALGYASIRKYHIHKSISEVVKWKEAREYVNPCIHGKISTANKILIFISSFAVCRVPFVILVSIYIVVRAVEHLSSSNAFFVGFINGFSNISIKEIWTAKCALGAPKRWQKCCSLFFRMANVWSIENCISSIYRIDVLMSCGCAKLCVLHE